MTLDEWIKVGISFIGAGFVGAIYNNWRTDRRNRNQPIGKNLSVSYVDIPKTIKGFEAFITLQSVNDQDRRNFHFQKLAIIQFKLASIGNTNFQEFDFGLSMPEKTGIIGIDYKSDDRKHIVTHTPEISVDEYFPQVDFILKPFNRKDVYHITIIANTSQNNLENEIEVSKTLPINFVDANIDKKLSINFGGLIFTFILIFGMAYLIIDNMEKVKPVYFVYIVMASLVGTFAGEFFKWKAK